MPCLGIPRDLIRYLSVGVINTLVGLSVIYLCMYALHATDTIANLAGYSVGLLCSFVLNRRWTFSSQDPITSQLVRFLLVLLVAYLANLGTVLGLTRLFGLNRYLAQAIGTGPYTAIGYLGSRFFAFRR
jgi:putative flippase GtrA